MSLLALLHSYLGTAGDAAAIVDLLLNLKKKTKKAYDSLPDSVKVKLNPGDAFQQFQDAMTQLQPHEEDAISELLARLDQDQAAQERFVMRAVIQGGLPNQEPTIRLLKFLARKSTDEALDHLRRLDFTTPHSTIPNAVSGPVVNAARIANARLGQAVQAVDNSVTASTLPTAAETIRQRMEAWAKR